MPATQALKAFSKQELSVKESKKKPTSKKTSVELFDEKIRHTLSNIGAESVNFELPPLPKVLSSKTTEQWFSILEGILYEWHHTEQD